MKQNRKEVFALGISLSLILAGMVYGQGLKEMMQLKAAALKQSVAANQAALRQYTWIEKTETSLRGEVKSTKIASCQYGPDGKVQKTLLSSPPPQENRRGLIGKIKEKKSEELKDYMEEAVQLIGHYVPPSPERIQLVLDAGKLALVQDGPDAMRLIFRDYIKPGDSVTFSVDSDAKMIRKITVNTYLDDQDKDTIVLIVNFQTLPDGTNYTAGKVLKADAKQMVVNIEESNYKKLAQ